jgi:hypothetical protein
MKERRHQMYGEKRRLEQKNRKYTKRFYDVPISE